MYWKYFCYLVGHKWNVFIECLKSGQFIHAITHDLSKFLPSEFIPYAIFFHSKDRYNNYKIGDEKDPNFKQGWLLHQKRNKHHWQYWICITRKDEIEPMPIPPKYVKQMITDWRGMARKFGGNPKDFYQKNKDTMIFHPKTMEVIESMLE